MLGRSKYKDSIHNLENYLWSWTNIFISMVMYIVIYLCIRRGGARIFQKMASMEKKKKEKRELLIVLFRKDVWVKLVFSYLCSCFSLSLTSTQWRTHDFLEYGKYGKNKKWKKIYSNPIKLKFLIESDLQDLYHSYILFLNLFHIFFKKNYNLNKHGYSTLFIQRMIKSFQIYSRDFLIVTLHA